MDDKAEYGLIMPFLDDSESFCHGYECGLMDARMQTGNKVERITIHTANIEQMKLLCQRYGYRPTFEDSGVEGWHYFEAVKSMPESTTRGLMQVIDGGKP